MTKHRTFNEYMISELKDPKEAKLFLDLAMEEYEKDQDMAALMLTFRLIAEAQGGIAKLADKSHLNRQNLYKILTGKAVPRLDTIVAMIRGLGFKLLFADIENKKTA